MTIGEKVKTARREKGISQKKLAALIGLSELTVIRLEKGQREPRPSELEKIAKVLGVPVSCPRVSRSRARLSAQRRRVCPFVSSAQSAQIPSPPLRTARRT